MAPERLAVATRSAAAGSRRVRARLPHLADPDQHSAVRGLASRLAVLTESHTGRYLEPAAGAPTVDLRRALDGSEVVLFSLNSSTYGGLAGMLGTLAVQDLVAAAGARLSAGRGAGGGAVVGIDEFSALGSDNVMALLARGREAGVGVLLATQELADLDRAGRGLRDQVLGNTALKIAHRQDVPESAETVARLAGTSPCLGAQLSDTARQRAAWAETSQPARGWSSATRSSPSRSARSRPVRRLVIVKVAHARSAPSAPRIRRQPPAPGVTR